MRYYIYFLISFLGYCNGALGQSTFWVDGQIRPRMEFRNGFQTLQSDSATAALLVEQRSRLGLGFKNDWLEVYLSAQDIRVWGSTPLINTSNGFFTLFQGWGKLSFSDRASLKIGRQVFSYDNQRILGGLNWAAAGRAHDAVLFEYKDDSSRLDLQVAAAYNAAGVSLNAQSYNLAGNYKLMQFVRFRKAFGPLDLRLLVMNIGRENSNQQLRFELTAGGLLKLKLKGFQAQLEGYYQYGSTPGDLTTNAFMAALRLSYQLKKFKFILGGDYLSGTDYDLQVSQNNSFNPWLGTNHAFYGHLDYFYVGNPHKNAGLIDGLFTLSYQPIKPLKMSLTYHYFMTPQQILDTNTGNAAANGQLGHELDFVLKYKIRPFVNLQLGYAHLLGSPSLELLKPTGEVDNLNHWAWLMLDVKLRMFEYKMPPKGAKKTPDRLF